MNYRTITAAFSLVALAACSGNTVKNTLGLERAAPDEFRVVSRPPLSVPPQFDLKPPSATAQSPNQLPADKQAQSLVLGAGKPAAATKETPASNAESAFLKRAGTDAADPNVRNKIVEDRIVVQEKQDDSSWWNIMSTNPPKKDPLVNAKKESERIQKNDDAGKPVTEGDTPTVKDRDTGILGRILGY